MNAPHSIVARIEQEHSYARPWFKKLNAPQRYPNAFSSIYTSDLDIGTVEDLQYVQRIHDHPNNMDLDLNDTVLVEQENKYAGDEITPEEIILDTSLWTQQMDRLYYKILQILQQYYLTKLVYEKLPHGRVRMVNLIENTSLQLRHSFSNIAGWDNELLNWLHNLFTTKIPSHDHLISTYHEVMQYLAKRLPQLIEKFYSVDRLPSSIATTPATSAATTPVHPASGASNVTGIPRVRHSSTSHPHQSSSAFTLEDDPAAKIVLETSKSMPRRLTSNPLILLVPGGPSIPSQPSSPRMEYWKTLLSSMGQLINLNIPFRPEQEASEILQVIKTSVRDKIRDTRKKKFNETRPLILVGFNQGSLIAVHCALENHGQVSAIICLGFPLSSINGFRGDLDDPILDLDIPILFIVGQMASAATIDALERLRESMARSDTSLVVVGGANDKLVMCYKKRMYEGLTQYHVDKSIAEEIYEFVNTISMQQPD